MWASFFRKKSIDKIISDQLDIEKLEGYSMVRNLGVRDLTFMGVAAIMQRRCPSQVAPTLMPIRV